MISFYVDDPCLVLYNQILNHDGILSFQGEKDLDKDDSCSKWSNISLGTNLKHYELKFDSQYLRIVLLMNDTTKSTYWGKQGNVRIATILFKWFWFKLFWLKRFAVQFCLHLKFLKWFEFEIPKLNQSLLLERKAKHDQRSNIAAACDDQF